jgi:hypothetical protein
VAMNWGSLRIESAAFRQQPVLLGPVDHRTTTQPESTRNLRDIAPTGLEHPHELIVLSLIALLAKLRDAAARLAKDLARPFGRHVAAGREGDEFFDHLSELADVSRPRLRPEQVDRPGLDADLIPPHTGRNSGGEMHSESGNVAATFPQRHQRNFETK